MCGRPVHHWGFFLASLGTEKAEKVRRSHVAESVADYHTFKKGVETLFAKFEFEGSFRAMLRTHAEAGAESVTAYAARTTDVCSKAYPNFSADTQLSLAVDHFVYGLADSTTGDYLSHDRACCTLPWQETVQMAQTCKAWRLSLNASPVAAAVASTKVGAPSLDECTRASANNTVAPVWQQSARDERVKSAAHSTRKFSYKNSRTHVNKSKGPSTAQ